MVVGCFALSGAWADDKANQSPPPEIPTIGETVAPETGNPVAASASVNATTTAASQAFSALQRIMDGEQLANETPDQTLISQTDGQSTSRMLGQMLMSLGLVVALVLGIAWVGKKFVLKNYTLGGGRIDVVTSLAISPKSKLHLVRVGEEQFLIGESPQSVNLISIVEPHGPLQLVEADEPVNEEPGDNGNGTDVTPFKDHMADWTRALENRAAPDVKRSLAMLQGLSQKLRGGGGRHG